MLAGGDRLAAALTTASCLTAGGRLIRGCVGETGLALAAAILSGAGAVTAATTGLISPRSAAGVGAGASGVIGARSTKTGTGGGNDAIAVSPGTEGDSASLFPLASSEAGERITPAATIATTGCAIVARG